MGRRRAQLLVLCAIALGAGSSAWADERKALSLVPRGASYHYLLHDGPTPARRYGAIIRHDLARAKGAAQGDAPQPLGRPVKRPAGWPAQGLSSGKSGEAPFASRESGEPCKCATPLPEIHERRAKVLYLSREFVLPAETSLDDMVLDIGLAYRDGVVLHVNGRELLRRNLDPAPPEKGQVSFAQRVRGPEWERFRVLASRAALKPGTNLLTVEVRPSRHRNGLAFDAELDLVPSGRLVRGPIVQRAHEGKAVILFDTDTAIRADLRYGDKSLEKTASSSGGALARHHRVELSGLEAGQRVHYRLEGAGLGDQVYDFHMPPNEEEPLSFAIYGDVRGGHKSHATIVDSLLGEAVDFVVVTGDMVLRGSDEGDWQRFFQVTSKLLARLPYYPVAGNHDLGQSGDEKRRMNEIFELWPAPAGRPTSAHWYSFDISGVHFVMLDSNRYEHEEQLRWLEADLKAAKKAGARAILAATHAGPYSRGLHGGHSYAAEHYVPLLRKYGVDLLVSGHDHLYQRGRMDGLDYIVSGGGGAPLYSVKCGVKGKKRCKKKDGMKHVAKEHHYIVVTVMPGYLRVCPKRMDGSALEACVNLGK